MVCSGGSGEVEPELLVGGRLLAEITNRIVALMREDYGRGLAWPSGLFDEWRLVQVRIDLLR